MGDKLRTKEVSHYNKANLKNQTYYEAYYTHTIKLHTKFYFPIRINILVNAKHLKKF